MSSSSKGTRVYLGKIPQDTREKEIEKFFKNYSPFTDITIKAGFAFIEFEERRDAEDAVHDLDGKDFLGSRSVVQFAKGYDRTRERPPSDYYERTSSRYDRPYNTEYRIIVEGISSRTSWRELKDSFRRIGDVTFADAHRHRDGEGVVDFKSRSAMEAAIRKMDGTDLDGRRIRVTAQDRESRSRSRSPKRSRSRSRSPRKRERSRS